jgi:hypothetical protein
MQEAIETTMIPACRSGGQTVVTPRPCTRRKAVPAMRIRRATRGYGAMGNRRAPAMRITQSDPEDWPPWGIDYRRRRGFPQRPEDAAPWGNRRGPD